MLKSNWRCSGDWRVKYEVKAVITDRSTGTYRLVESLWIVNRSLGLVDQRCTRSLSLCQAVICLSHYWARPACETQPCNVFYLFGLLDWFCMGSKKLGREAFILWQKKSFIVGRLLVYCTVVEHLSNKNILSTVH